MTRHVFTVDKSGIENQMSKEIHHWQGFGRMNSQRGLL